jgi:hypothetical protein
VTKHSLIESRLADSDGVPGAGRREAPPGVAATVKILTIRNDAHDTFDQAVQITNRDNQRRIAGDLRDRAASVARDDGTASLSLDDDTAELLHPCLGRTTGYQHDVRRLEVDAIRDTQSRRHPSGQHGFRPLAADHETCRPISVHSREDAYCVVHSLLRNEPPDKHEHDFLGVQGLCPGLIDGVVVAERQHLDYSAESLASEHGGRLVAAWIKGVDALVSGVLVV